MTGNVVAPPCSIAKLGSLQLAGVLRTEYRAPRTPDFELRVRFLFGLELPRTRLLGPALRSVSRLGDLERRRRSSLRLRSLKYFVPGTRNFVRSAACSD